MFLSLILEFYSELFILEIHLFPFLIFNLQQSLSHVTPLRNYFLREENYSQIKRPPGDQAFLLVQRFGELIRKLWNPRNFKAHVSPHEMLQAVVLCSKKRFQITQQGFLIDIVLWILFSVQQYYSSIIVLQMVNFYHSDENFD